MATFYKRTGKRGVRWTARVRIKGREHTRTWSTKAAAEAWARAQEAAVDRGEHMAPRPGSGALFTDLIDEFIEHRKRISRPPGATFAHALKRFKDEQGLEPLGNLTVAFWRKYALDRVASGASGSTVAGDLAYSSSVLYHASREGHNVDAAAPGKARTMLREDGVRVTSRQRLRRLTDAEIKSLLDWFDTNKERTSLPMRDIVEFALATGMRRGEIVALRRADIEDRVANIKRKHPIERDRVDAVPLLKAHAVWPRVDPLEIVERQPTGGPRVFPYLGDTVGHWFEQATIATGLDGVVFHVLRHECLSRLADRGFDPLRLAMIGGHRDLRNVKRYARLDAARLANE